MSLGVQEHWTDMWKVDIFFGWHCVCWKASGVAVT
jgi:hypothetical protein